MIEGGCQRYPYNIISLADDEDLQEDAAIAAPKKSWFFILNSTIQVILRYEYILSHFMLGTFSLFDIFALRNILGIQFMETSNKRQLLYTIFMPRTKRKWLS